MGLDIRYPLGLIFTITGVIMMIYGLLTNGSNMYAQSDGMNINAIWGIVMFVFGALMLVLGRRSARRSATRPPSEVAAAPRPGMH